MYLCRRGKFDSINENLKSRTPHDTIKREAYENEICDALVIGTRGTAVSINRATSTAAVKTVAG